ncbi:queuosine biosynthesis protein [Synechococcus phage BUCT-ZZ01]|nr:queuosine biosynthesis protein [Synechococcus phage BUCT-ZZ01]
MKKIKVTEMFYSVQGEGRFTGAPSVFLRTYGCNFECRGFSMPEGQKTDEPERILASIDLSTIKHISELPLSSTGCDSYVSWHPKVKHLAETIEIEELAQRLVDLTPNKSFSGIDLVITGGEPLLGWQKAYPALLDILFKRHHLSSVTFETNGTQKLVPEFEDYIKDKFFQFHFSVSAKLSCSGHTAEEAIKPEVLEQYVGTLAMVDLKFVVDPNQENSIQEIKDTIKKYQEGKSYQAFDIVYLMPEGGVGQTYEANASKVAKIALENGWHFSPRLQVPLFKNEWGT